jgi:hypothetical protein
VVVSRVQLALVILAACMIPILAIMFTLRALGSSNLLATAGCDGAYIILAISLCAAYMLSYRDIMRSYRDKVRARSKQQQ